MIWKSHRLAGALALTLTLVSCDKPAAPGTAAPSGRNGAPAASAAEKALTESTKWPHVGSDLKPDPTIGWKALPNGLRLVVMPNAEPPGRVSLRLYVETGSLMESDDQRGLAHFLEHMAFNGTKNFPAGEMVEYFQRLGMGFGADTNAHTSFRETVYKLELPPGADKKAPDEKTLHDGFQLLRDMADAMLLDPAEIDKERGIILSEKTARDTVGFRIFQEGFKFQLPDHLISKRMPIGTEEIISQAPPDRFKDFYRKYYTPDRMVLVAVGAVDPKATLDRMAEVFGTLEKRPSTPDPDFGQVTRDRGVATKAHLEKEAGDATISFSVMLPYQPRIDTKATRLEELRRELASLMIQRRFEILAKEKDSPLLQAEVGIQPFLQLIDAASIDITAPPTRWNDAVALGARELKRALKFGFAKSELAEAAAAFLKDAQDQANGASTRKSKELADGIVKALGEGRVFTDPVAELPRIKETLAKITPEECHQAFMAAFSTRERLTIFAAGNMVPPTNGETLEAALQRGMTAEITAPEEKAALSFGYTEFGPAGQVTGTKNVDDLGITQLVFGNNVRVNLKPTTFKKDEVLVQASFGKGKLALPQDKPGLELYVEGTFDMAALGKHSVDDLQRILSGKTVSSEFQVGEDAFTLVGKSTREDLATQLQLLTAFLADPGWREEADRVFRPQVDALYEAVEHMLEHQGRAKIEPYLRGNDYRFAFPKKEEVLARTMDDAKAWLGPILKSAPLEIGIVGDFDAAEATKLMAATFGALPPRDAVVVPAPQTDVKLAFPPVGPKRFDFQSQIAKGLVASYFPTVDRSDIRRTRRVQVLAEVFGDRLRDKIREKLGESYSPRAMAQSSEVFPGYGYMMAQCIVTPGQADKVAAAVREIADEVNANGVTQDQLDRALKPLLNAIEEQRRNNIYWLTTVVSTSQSQPRRLDWARSMIDDFKSVTTADLNALAKEYVKKDAMREVFALPHN